MPFGGLKKTAVAGCPWFAPRLDSAPLPRRAEVRLYALLSSVSELPSLYLVLSERQRKSKAEHPVNNATVKRIIASRVQGSPAERRPSTSISIVLIHSRAPRTRMICTRRAIQARLKNRRTGRSRARMTMGISPCLRKCAPSSKELKTTGSSRRTFIISISILSLLVDGQRHEFGCFSLVHHPLLPVRSPYLHIFFLTFRPLDQCCQSNLTRISFRTPHVSTPTARRAARSASMDLSCFALKGYSKIKTKPAAQGNAATQLTMPLMPASASGVCSALAW
jgi:hypothetical protein